MNRDEILRRFESLLDASLSSENPPEGIDAELLATAASEGDSVTGTDAYALWSAMTALTQEIRLQGRAFRELSEAVAAQTAGITSELQAIGAQSERDCEQRVRRRILDGLVDLRDRLARGLESATTALSARDVRPTGWLARFAGSPKASAPDGAVVALQRGYELGLERLDQMLSDFGATQIACKDLPFDPRRMNAIEVEDSTGIPEGTVLEVYRSGYEWNGEVFRTAQVKVSRARKGDGHE